MISEQREPLILIFGGTPDYAYNLSCIQVNKLKGIVAELNTVLQ